MSGMQKRMLATGMLLHKLRWQARFAVYLFTSAGACTAIWWFWKHGWPQFISRDRLNTQSLQVWLFMLAPWAVLFAIVEFFYRDTFNDTENHKKSDDQEFQVIELRNKEENLPLPQFFNRRAGTRPTQNFTA